MCVGEKIVSCSPSGVAGEATYKGGDALVSLYIDPLFANAPEIRGDRSAGPDEAIKMKSHVATT